AGVPMQPGPRLRFGITPAGEAGALGPAVPVVPDDPPRTLAALDRLRAPKAPLVLRLNRFLWADGEAGMARFLALAKRYTDAGYLVELQVRYHPAAGQEGNVAGFVAFVREVVDRFGPNRRVVGLQVTNEVNFTISPDSSDGAYAGARDALVAAMSALRTCFMPIAGLGRRVPVHVEENGWPTGPGRAEDAQARSLQTMVRAVHDFRGTYGVTDYRWFDLRDHNTASANFQHHYGLLRDDYSPKAGFGVYRRLVDELARREPDGGLGRPRLGLRLAYGRG